MRSHLSAIAIGAVLALAIAGSPGRVVPVSTVLADDAPPPTATEAAASRDGGGLPIVLVVTASTAFVLSLGYLLRTERRLRR